MPRKAKSTTRARGKPHAVVKRKAHEGRELTLTPEITAEIEQILKEGNYQTTAYQCVGISRQTYYNWLEWGQDAGIKKENGEELSKDEALLFDFFDRIKKAVAFSKRRNITIIAKAGEKDWHAAAWMLERTDPEHYARRDKVDVNSKSKIDLKTSMDKGQVEEIIQSLSDEELARIVRDAKQRKEQGEHSDTTGLPH